MKNKKIVKSYVSVLIIMLMAFTNIAGVTMTYATTNGNETENVVASVSEINAGSEDNIEATALKEKIYEMLDMLKSGDIESVFDNAVSSNIMRSWKRQYNGLVEYDATAKDTIMELVSSLNIDDIKNIEIDEENANVEIDYSIKDVKRAINDSVSSLLIKCAASFVTGKAKNDTVLDILRTINDKLKNKKYDIVKNNYKLIFAKEDDEYKLANVVDIVNDLKNALGGKLASLFG